MAGRKKTSAGRFPERFDSHASTDTISFSGDTSIGTKTASAVEDSALLPRLLQPLWSAQRHVCVDFAETLRAGVTEEVTTDDMEIVPALRAALAERVGTDRYEMWFGTAHLALNEQGLSVGVPNRFYLEWIRTNFRPQLEAACTSVLGHCPRVDYSVDAALADLHAPAAATATATVEAEALRSRSSESSSSTAVAVCEPVVAALASPAGPARRTLADLESFVSGATNQLAVVSAHTAVQRPGQITPLVFYGPSSVGKTHLLQGIYTASRRRRPTGRVIYLSAEQFTTGFLEALRGSGLPSFRRKYRGVELLVLDDLQFFSGKRATQLELLHTVDELLHEGRQLVFAADRPPTELSEWIPELTTRLNAGMVCRIEAPDYATRLRIVAQLARRARVQIPADVQEYIASRLTNHARELTGAICRLQAASQAWGRPITRSFAEDTLAEMIRQSSRVVGLADIEKALCEVLGVDPAGLQSGRKAKGCSYPRMLAMWLARKHTRAPLSEIGNYFGRRSHSTVVSAQKRVDTWVAAGSSIEFADHLWSVDDAIRQVEKRLQVG